MVPLPAAEVFAGLVVLFLVTLPLGSLLLRLMEQWIGRRLDLSGLERVLLAFYATGGLFFVLASIPLPLYQPAVVLGILTIGGVVWAALSVRDRGRDLRSAFNLLRSPTTVVLVVLTGGLLLLEVVSVSSFVVGNGVDGSVYSLFVQLILRNHTVPWTLAPYAATGVIYPQGAPVWMTLPAFAFGWPVPSIPVVLPPLFLALSAPAAFCLGQRLTSTQRPGSPVGGLLFAGFFGLVASWPRLFVGGSFDFLFSLPLFLLILGWLYPLATGPVRSWREVLALGCLLGVVAALSASTGMTLALLLLVFLVALSGDRRLSLRRWGVRFLAILGIVSLFLVRSFVGAVVWYGYPGHVLADVGQPPYASYGFPNPLNGSTLLGELDPFLPWKPKLSPFPPLSLTIAVLLAVGLGLLVVNALHLSRRLRWHLPLATTRTVLLASVTIFVEELFLLIASGLNASAAGLQSVTNFNEISILLFTCFQLAALVPLLCALNYLTGRKSASGGPVNRGSVGPSHRETSALWRRSGETAPGNGMALRTFGAVALLLLPLSLGLGFTVAEVPSYIHDHIEGLANVTSGDLAVLEWSGAHLGSCSRVLVAPGSVAQYLPEYADVQMVYPVFPPTVNLSYYDAVDNLVDGVYLNSTRVDLVELGVTEVFVTGQTTAAYLPFQLPPLLGSSDFSLLEEQQDAAILAFEPGVHASGCPV